MSDHDVDHVRKELADWALQRNNTGRKFTLDIRYSLKLTKILSVVESQVCGNYSLLPGKPFRIHDYGL